MASLTDWKELAFLLQPLERCLFFKCICCLHVGEGRIKALNALGLGDVLWFFRFCKFIPWSLAKPKCCLLFREAFISYWKLSGLEDGPCLWFLGECSCVKTQLKKECTPALLCWTHWESTPYSNLELAAVIRYCLKHVWNCITDKEIVEKPWVCYFLCKSNMQFGNI